MNGYINKWSHSEYGNFDWKWFQSSDCFWNSDVMISETETQISIVNHFNFRIKSSEDTNLTRSELPSENQANIYHIISSVMSNNKQPSRDPRQQPPATSRRNRGSSNSRPQTNILFKWTQLGETFAAKGAI